MTIEEVSVLFDTGRKGDAQAAARQFNTGKDGKEDALTYDLDDHEEKQPHINVASHVEKGTS